MVIANFEYPPALDLLSNAVLVAGVLRQAPDDAAAVTRLFSPPLLRLLDIQL